MQAHRQEIEQLKEQLQEKLNLVQSLEAQSAAQQQQAAQQPAQVASISEASFTAQQASQLGMQVHIDTT